jgi:tRNA(fMet)-specific endonuclease VapC
MTIWVLDTDHVSLFQRGHPSVVQRVNSISAKNLAVTVITLEEQMYGRLNQIKRAKNTESITEAYLKLRATVNYFNSIQLLDFDGVAYSCYLELLAQKIRIGTQDLKIGAIALSIKGILVTRNIKDFQKIPNLVFEDWSVI